MRIQNAAFLLVILLSIKHAPALAPAEIEEQRQGLARWRAEIEQCRNLPPERAIPHLTACVVKMSKPAIYQLDEKEEVRREALAALLAIPGHAEWHRDQIERERAKITPGDSGSEFVFHDRRQEHIDDLGHLPSPETVRVLGEMLDDLRDAPPVNASAEASALWVATRYRATWSFGSLGIVNPPADNTTRGVTAEDRLERWKLWYAQVKAGTRTFRFEGSNVEHRLAPAPEGRRPVKDPGPAALPGPSAGASPSTQDSDGTRPRWVIPLWPWVAGVLALTLLGLWWLKRRQPADTER